MDYSELVKDLRVHRCDAKEDDTQDVCEECAYDVIIADKSTFSGIKDVCTCGLMHRAADAIEELKKDLERSKEYESFWENAAKTCKAKYEELQLLLQKSEADNVNLTGWLAEEHAKNCPHYIRNVHDRGDDSLCDVLMTEPPRVDPCADCVHYPPSSMDGKPCCACDPANPLTNCHEAKEETE